MPAPAAVVVAGALAVGALLAVAVPPQVGTVLRGSHPAPSAAQTAPAPPTGRQAGRAILPVQGAVLVRGFEEPAVRWGPGHRGVDLAVTVGTPVGSPAAGVVVFAGRVVDREVITVRHADGLRSSLEPVSADVAVGAAVAPGDVVGHLGTGGHCTGCLHWGVRDGERYLDPLSLLGSDGVVRLLPGAVDG